MRLLVLISSQWPYKICYPAISTFAVQICYTNKCLLYSYQRNKLFSLRINFPGTLQLCTAEGADKYETGINVTRTTKKTPLTTFLTLQDKHNKYTIYAILPVSKARTNTFYIYRQCTYIVYLLYTSKIKVNQMMRHRTVWGQCQNIFSQTTEQYEYKQLVIIIKLSCTKFEC